MSLLIHTNLQMFVTERSARPGQRKSSPSGEFRLLRARHRRNWPECTPLSRLGGLLLIARARLRRRNRCCSRWRSSAAGRLLPFLQQERPSNPIAQCWLFFIALATITESVCLLVAIRNLIVLNLVESHNASEFMLKGAGVMLMPVRLNFVAVLATFLALNFFSIYSYGETNWLGFLIIIIIPCVLVMLHSIGAGIAAFHSTQPWHRKAFWEKLYRKYEDFRHAPLSSPSSTSSVSPGQFVDKH